MAISVGNRNKARATATTTLDPKGAAVATPDAALARIAQLEAELAAVKARAERGVGISWGLGEKGAISFQLINADGRRVASGWFHRGAMGDLIEGLPGVGAEYDATPEAERETMRAAAATRSAAYKARNK